jgi:putative Ca2+/H+ antiporter (TMEM165/GDT1 family)
LDFNAILQAVANHQWELLGGLVVGAVIATAKQGWLGSKIQKLFPAKYIPFLAPTYAALGVLGTDLVTGKSFTVIVSTVGSAIFSGFAATLGHEMLIEGLRGGKEIIPERVPSAPKDDSKKAPPAIPPSG